MVHDYIVLYDNDREVLRVKYPDGAVVFGEGATTDEVSRMFWRQLGAYIAEQVRAATAGVNAPVRSFAALYEKHADGIEREAEKMRTENTADVPVRSAITEGDVTAALQMAHLRDTPESRKDMRRALEKVFTAGVEAGVTPSPEGFGKVDLAPPPRGATRPAKAVRTLRPCDKPGGCDARNCLGCGERVPCARCTSDIYCEMNGCQRPATCGVQPSVVTQQMVDAAMREIEVRSHMKWALGAEDMRAALIAAFGVQGTAAPTVFDELVAFEDECEVKPTFADAVRIALAAKQRAAGVSVPHASVSDKKD